MKKPHSWSKVAGILLAALSLPLSATNPYCPKWLDGDFHIANNHLWRGIEVSDGLVMTSSVMPTCHFRFLPKRSAWDPIDNKQSTSSPSSYFQINNQSG